MVVEPGRGLPGEPQFVTKGGEETVRGAGEVFGGGDPGWLARVEPLARQRDGARDGDGRPPLGPDLEHGAGEAVVTHPVKDALGVDAGRRRIIERLAVAVPEVGRVPAPAGSVDDLGAEPVGRGGSHRIGGAEAGRRERVEGRRGQLHPEVRRPGLHREGDAPRLPEPGDILFQRLHDDAVRRSHGRSRETQGAPDALTGLDAREIGDGERLAGQIPGDQEVGLTPGVRPGIGEVSHQFSHAARGDARGWDQPVPDQLVGEERPRQQQSEAEQPGGPGRRRERRETVHGRIGRPMPSSRAGISLTRP